MRLPGARKIASSADEVVDLGKRVSKGADAVKGGFKPEKIAWPPNGGAVVGTEKNVVLTKGYKFDRF